MMIVLIHRGDVEDGTEFYGPFATEASAWRFADDYNEACVRPAYIAEVVDMQSVRDGRRAIRHARDQDER